MPLFLPLTDPPPEHPSVLALKRAYKVKAERVLHDPEYRASLPIQWWTDDLSEIRRVASSVGSQDSLDTWESSVEIQREDTYDQRFRFQRWALERSFWLDHLPLVEKNDGRVQRWVNCGKNAWIWRDPTDDRLFLRSSTCKLRICPACRRRYQFAAIARIRDLLQDAKPRTWQFITLTIRHTKAPLATQVEHLKASFRRLRQRRLWSQAVAHGYAVLEVTYNSRKDEWHPHLHVLARVRFIDWRALRQDWASVTGGSNIIDCGHVRNVGSACDYVARYLGKPPNLTELSDGARIAEYYEAIQHARFLMPFGKPPKPKRTATLDTPRKLQPIGRLTDLHVAARRGEQDAAKVLRALAHQQAAAWRSTDPELRHAITSEASHFDPCDQLLPPP